MDYDDNEDDYYDVEGGAGEEEEEEEDDDVEDGRQDGPYHLRRARASMGAGSGGRHRGGMGGDQGNLYGYPTYPHSGEFIHISYLLVLYVHFTSFMTFS